MTYDPTEAEWMRQVTDLAELYGWSWAHFRPAKTQRGWRTPVSGPLGQGWPDLTLVKDDRLVFAELKRRRSRPTPDQTFVLTLLAEAAEVYVWRPEDIDDVATILSGREHKIGSRQTGQRVLEYDSRSTSQERDEGETQT